jgi:2,5-furandicarboxylate decarboxylase 1
MSTAVKDLRSFLRDLQARHPDDVVSVRKEVDPRREVTLLAWTLAQAGRFPVLMCPKVKGSQFPIVSNVHADRRKAAVALGTGEDQVVAEYVRRLGRPVAPVLVEGGPVQEVVLTGREVDLSRFPIVTHWEDGGPYITAGVGILKDAETGALNLGVYRHMVHAPDVLGIWLNPLFHGGEFLRRAERQGRPVEAAIAVGAHPALGIASQNREAMGSDDYGLAGALLEQPLRVTRGAFVSFPVPADAEIVIEGVVPPGVRKLEGPFGEYPSTYGPRREAPVMEVKAITHRRDAIYQDLNSAQQEHLALWIVPGREASLYARVKAVFPTLTAVHIPFSGAGYHACLAIEKVRDGDGKNVILSALGADPLLKHVVAVDDDIDVFRESEVLYAIATRVQADQSTFVIPGSRTSPLDPSSYGLTKPYSGEGLVTKMGIDATRPLGVPFPERIRPTAEERDRIRLEEYL